MPLEAPRQERCWSRTALARCKALKKHPHNADGIKRLCLVLVKSRRNFVSTHGTDDPFSLCCVVLVYEEILRACRGVPGGGAPEKGRR